MELYTLDSQLRREFVYDKFESLIWTERFAAEGDFSITLHSTPETKRHFKAGTHLAINESHRVMVVKTLETSTDVDGKSLLTVGGPSLETILRDRVARDTWSNLTDSPVWIFNGQPRAIAKGIFDAICRDGLLDVKDKIPFLTAGTIFPADTNLFPEFDITHAQDPATVYDAIQGLCNEWGMGFRLYRNFDTSQLRFNIYVGRNRTTTQNTDLPVIFSVDFGNLQNTKELVTTENAKNVAYVVSPHGTVMVYADGVDPTESGFERKVLLIKDDTVTAEMPDTIGALTRVGKMALSRHRTFLGIDGELDRNSMYKYGVHYNLGDFVEMRSDDGVISPRRVTEQIFVSDGEGDRSYPTLSTEQVAIA